MFLNIKCQAIDVELPEILKKFSDSITNKVDNKTLKLYLFQEAYEAIVDAMRNDYYRLEDLYSSPNYTEVCEWCEWPDLQDNGIFEQAINAAWNVARYSHGLKPMEACVKSRGKQTV